MLDLKKMFLILVGLSSSVCMAKAIDKGTISRIEGEVRILSFPKRKATGKGPHVKYEGKYYRYREASLGQVVRVGSIVQAMANAKARIIFENGDQITVTPASSYRMRRIREQSVVDVAFGKIRAVIKKDGENKGLQVKTRSMTMGVRGTDFYVASYGPKSELAVLRGEVEAKSTATPKAKPVIVPKGYSVAVKAPVIEDKAEQKSAPVKPGSKKERDLGEAAPLAVKKINKKELVVIQKSSTVAMKKPKAKVLTPEIKKVIELEKKAVENTMKDIKEDDPELYKAIMTSKKSGDVADVDLVQTDSVKKLYKKAPEAPKDSKPFNSELEDLGEGAYDEYFSY